MIVYALQKQFPKIMIANGVEKEFAKIMIDYALVK